jgi:hypothetical protein
VYFYGGSMWRNDHLTLAGCEIGEESAGNFKLAVHRVLCIEVIELSMWYIQFSFLRFFVFYIFFSFVSHALFVTEGHCVYHRTDWPCPINHNNTQNVIITAERALYGYIANTRGKWAELIVWFVGEMITWILVIGGRFTWILVYWRKAHVNFGLLEEETREIFWWSRYGSWNGHHWCVCTDFLASVFTEYTSISLFFEGCI